MKVVCRTCVYVEYLGKGERAGKETEVGTCMRYPPQVSRPGSAENPIVGMDTSWCGEHKAKRAERKSK